MFHAAANEDAKACLSRFEKYITYRGFNERDKVNFLAIVLRDDATDWYDSLPAESTNTWAHLKEVFEQRFKDTDCSNGKRPAPCGATHRAKRNPWTHM